MDDSLLSHVVLCECLDFSEGKRRSMNISDQSKYLSSLALLLNGSSSCTAVYVHRANHTVLIARNEPISPNDERYFDRFFRQMRIYASLCFNKEKTSIVSDADTQLRSLVFEYNSKKIVNRFLDRKSQLIDQLRKMAEWNATEKSRFVDELRSHPELYRDKPLAAEKIYLRPKNYNEEDYVQIIFTELSEFLRARDELIDNQSNPTDQQLASATGRAFTLYESRLFRYILDYSAGTAVKGVHFFEKTSAHERSINLLLKCLLYRRDQLASIYQNISWKLVPSIQEIRPRIITPKRAFERIFAELSLSSDESLRQTLEIISSQTFYNQYLQRIVQFEDNPFHSVHTHAEILLINHLLENNINEYHHSNEVQIGISKMPCLLCSFYIDGLNKKHQRCFVPSDSTNGKIYSKWSPRKNEDPSILDMINNKLIAKLQQSIKKLCLENERSSPKKSGDNDIMLTSIEGDDFDLSRWSKIHR